MSYQPLPPLVVTIVLSFIFFQLSPGFGLTVLGIGLVLILLDAARAINTLETKVALLEQKLFGSEESRK